MNLAEAQKLWDPEPGWLNTATYGLPPRPAYDELQAALTDWRHGHTDWRPWDTSVTRSRTAFAHLIGADPTDITISATASAIIGQIATALPPTARVLTPDIEFTSNLFPWATAADLHTAPPDHLADAITPDTTAVAFSLVQSATGQLAPLADIITAARAHDTLVIVDASQACGWLPITLDGIDALVCAAYKWLMAPRGAAFGYLSPHLRTRMRPTAANWYAGADPGGSFYGPPLRLAEDARAFDQSPAWFSYVGAAPALELINQIGAPAIAHHNITLANRFRTGLGLPPSDSAIVSVPTTPDAAQRLTAAGVRTAARAGNLRASFHLYTTADDVDRALEALR